MKLSSNFIGILNAHGFCVDEISTDNEHIGTTYVISRAILGKVAFRVCVESGNTMLDFIDNLEEKKNDYEHAYEEGALPDDVIYYGKTSLDEIILLAEKMNRIHPSTVFDYYRKSVKITLNNDTTLFLLQNKEDEKDVKAVIFEGVGEKINYNSVVTEYKLDFSKLCDFVLGNPENDKN